MPNSWSGNIICEYYNDITLGKGVPVLYDRTPRPPGPGLRYRIHEGADAGRRGGGMVTPAQGERCSK